ncbi:hypothetical protein AVEN_234044-1 [Araneus ventricosus]|uniref:CCHC-type domain-containing protein n=1 Tax=Araneus ventricosus TaxID=182803 RepID=A0A4Y2FH70_ARAVE|nr:hypothetical protein AVEN_234044-1 [Araneus ventricosus]
MLGSKSSRKNVPDSQSKVGGVSAIEQLISQIKDFDFDPDVVDDIFTQLQDLIEIYTSKSRDIKAGVRDSLNERVIAPLIKFIKDRETTHLANMYDLKAREVDFNIRQYQAKIRESESTIEYLRGKLNLLNTELFDFKKVLKDSSQGLLETTKEVQSIISKATPSFSQVLQSRPAVPVRAPVSQTQENHVVLLRPKKDSTSEENRKLVENALVVRNSAARINRISKVSRGGGLIIEAPTLADLEALQAEISCVPSLEEHFEVSKPKRRRPPVIILGLPNDVDKDRLMKGLSAKNHFMCDAKNNLLFEVNFSIRAKFSTNWIVSVDLSIYKRLFDDSGLYFEFSRFKFDNFFGVKQCKHCRRFGHTTKWCPRAKDVLCDHCGGDHPSASCKEVSCINCKESNQRTG